MRLKDWRNLFTNVSLKKSDKYIDVVANFNVENNEVTGIVKEDDNNYKVSFKINADREVSDLRCECEFSQISPCKHEAALISYYEKNTEDELVYANQIYKLDLIGLAKDNLLNENIIDLFKNRSNISIPNYRYFVTKTDKGQFYEIICEKYEEGKGRLFFNENEEFFVLDVDIKKDNYAIFDIFMAAKTYFPLVIKNQLKEFDKYLENKLLINSLNDLSNSLSQKTFCETLEIEPILDLKNKSVSFRILLNKPYPIKDLKAFSNAILNYEVQSYSKYTFIHGYEYFSKTSQKYLDFILHQVNLNLDIQKDIKLDNPYTIDFFFSRTKGKKLKVEGKGDIFVQSSNQRATILLNKDSLEIFEKEKILFVGNLGAYYDNYDIIEYRKFYNHQTRNIFAYLSKIEGKLELHGDILNTFLIKVFPKIKKYITITDEFYEENDVPNVEIKTFLDEVENKTLLITPRVYLNNKPAKEETPYINALFNEYKNTLEDNYKVVNVNNRYIIEPIKDQYNFLTSPLTDIKEFGNILISEEVAKIKPKPHKKLTINAKYNVNFLELKLEGLDYTKEEIELILKAYKSKQKYVRLKNGSILELNEQFDYLRELVEDFDLKLDEDFSSLKRPLSYSFKLLNHEGYDVVLDEKLELFFKNLKDFKKKEYYIPESLKTLLKPYQIEANSWLNTLANSGFGGILADDMGLGKTIEMISLLLGDKVEKPSLVVCPMSLVYNWQQEILKWNIDIECVPIIGSQPVRKEIISSITENKKVIYISSYDSVRRDIKLYTQQFRFVIADEAQYIKNQNAQKSEAIKQINSEVRFALTGTPIENGLQDMWNIFDFIAPGYLSNYSSFKNRYENLILNKDNRALKRLRNKLMPFILRRTKKDVLKELPEKTENIYYTKLNAEEQKLYDATVLKLKNEVDSTDGAYVLSTLMRLRQICVDPRMFLTDYKEESSKLLLCIDILKKAINGNHKTLIFSQFTSVFDNLEALLNKEGIKFLKITGKTKAEERIRLVNEFNESNIYVMLISLKAGGTGLNLQSADTVIHLDPWWNISVENQATDRVHRIGQKNQVNVIKLVCKNTIEDKVIELQQIKKNLADSIVDYANSDKLTLKDIKELLN